MFRFIGVIQIRKLNSETLVFISICVALRFSFGIRLTYAHEIKANRGVEISSSENPDLEIQFRYAGSGSSSGSMRKGDVRVVREGRKSSSQK